MRRTWLAIFILAFIGPGVGRASAAQNITVSPTSIEQAVDAGKSVSGTIAVIDDGDTAYTATVYATPYGVSGEDYNQSYQLQPGFSDASKWFHFDKTSYSLQPHQNISIPYTIKVPAGTGPGGYYSVIFAEAQPQAATSSGVTVRKRVGTIVYLRVNGAVSEEGRVVSWEVAAWQTEASIKGAVRLENKGNIHYSADVQMTVTDLFGRTKAQISTTRFVLPQTIRRVELTWPNAPGFGLFKVSGTASFLQQHEALPVRYVLIMSQTAFLGVVAAILALIGLAWILRRRSQRQ